MEPLVLARESLLQYLQRALEHPPDRLLDGRDPAIRLKVNLKGGATLVGELRSASDERLTMTDDLGLPQEVGIWQVAAVYRWGPNREREWQAVGAALVLAVVLMAVFSWLPLPESSWQTSIGTAVFAAVLFGPLYLAYQLRGDGEDSRFSTWALIFDDRAA